MTLVSNASAGSMNERRNEAIEKTLARLHKIREDLLSGTRGCKFECRSMTYGALTLEMHSKDLLSSTLAVPFQGLSYQSLFQKVNSFKSPEWNHRWCYMTNECRPSFLTTLAGELDGCIEGLDINPPIKFSLFSWRPRNLSSGSLTRTLMEALTSYYLYRWWLCRPSCMCVAKRWCATGF